MAVRAVGDRVSSMYSVGAGGAGCAVPGSTRETRTTQGGTSAYTEGPGQAR